jgi:hypothetical protein
MASLFFCRTLFQIEKFEQTDGANPRPFGTSVMLPADSAARAGSTPEASGDSSSGTFGKQMSLLFRRLSLHRTIQLSLGLLLIHNIWLGSTIFRNDYYNHWPDQANAIDIAFLIIWILLFLVGIGPWLFLDRPVGAKIVYIIGAIVGAGVLSLCISSIFTNAYMATIY